MHSNNRQADTFTKSKLFGSSKRVLYMQQKKKQNSLFLYMFLQKERERSQADGVKLVTELLTFFRHYACDLIVLECLALVTSQR